MSPAEIIIIILLVFHIAFIALWAGAAALTSSIIFPSLSQISLTSRAEFIIAALPRLTRFIVGVSTGAVLAGVILFGYETREATGYAPSSLGTTFIAVGAIIGLISYVLALGVAYPTANKLVKALKGAKDTDKTSNSMPAEISRMQVRMRMVAGASSGLLGLAIVLMVIGAAV
jgi:uncharacterized membrane protein